MMVQVDDRSGTNRDDHSSPGRRGTSDRGVSTVVDVALCLVLVSAAVFTVATVPATDDDADSGSSDADRAAETIAATTVDVEYSVEPAIGDDPDTGSLGDVDDYDDETLTRAVHGPTAGLLADAAIANVRVDGERVTRAGAEFEDALDAEIASLVPTRADRLQVVAVWEPYDGAPIRGRATAGTEPPPDADVDSATTTVPSGFPAVREAALEAAETGDHGDVAAIVAAAVVEGHFPPRASQHALEGSGFDRAIAVHRYRRMADTIDGVDSLGLDADLVQSGGNASAANAKLADAIAETLEDDLEERYDDPEAAAAAVSNGRVTIVVRTWSDA